MNITVQIGLTPDLEKTLTNLLGAINAGQAPQQQVQQAPIQQQPVINQPVQQPYTQQMPTQQPMQGVPTAVPTQQAPAPVQHQQPPVQQQQAPQGVPTTTHTYDMNQLAVAATQLMDANRQQDVLTLFSQFGVQSLMQLPQEQYGAFATKLREMGAKI